MASYGLLPTGFVPKTLTVIKSELEAAFQAAFGQSIDLAPEGPFGQLIGIPAERFAELWEVAQAEYAANDPTNASGQRLVAMCAITGTLPQAATSSTVTLTCTGTPGTALAAGRVASVVGTGVNFDTTVLATIAAATAWASTHAYTAGAFVTNGGNIYVCTTLGTSAGSGGPTGTDPTVDIVDGTVHWAFVGVGTGYVQVNAASELTGPIVANVRTCTTISTPVSGWNNVTNLSAAAPGLAADTDVTLRARRVSELPGQSRSTVDAIRTRVSEDVAGATNVIVFQNITDVTNSDGMPPHSVEVLVMGGLDQDITDAVFANVAAGIATTGNQTGTHVDALNGNQSYTVKWSRPSGQNVYIIANVTKDPTAFPADGAAQILTAIAAVGASYVPGKDCVASQLVAACFKVVGVLDVTVFIGLAPAPATSVTIPIALRQIAVLDTVGRTTLNLSDGTP